MVHPVPSVRANTLGTGTKMTPMVFAVFAILAGAMSGTWLVGSETALLAVWGAGLLVVARSVGALRVDAADRVMSISAQTEIRRQGDFSALNSCCTERQTT